MSRQPKRFDEFQQKALLQAIADCRHACAMASMFAPVDGEVYRRIGTLMEGIDKLGETITGDGDHFLAPSFSIREAHKPPVDEDIANAPQKSEGMTPERLIEVFESILSVGIGKKKRQYNGTVTKEDVYVFSVSDIWEADCLLEFWSQPDLLKPLSEQT